MNISQKSMPSRKIDSYIGFAVRSGDVIYGLDSFPSYTGRIELIMYDAQTGAATLRKLKNLCKREDIKAIKCKSGYISGAVHRENVKLIAVTSKSLANAILLSDELGIITEVESE